ncbi:alpha/beta fold hydrolase [Paeniglutamicibacter sp. R2-26]|uniref:alpha/beta fold hydrolase n=1 Tax=Paeniglutamicibacter sp. R2-26 TaxID=3144417 RepID=UPI003EE58737
MGRHLNVHTGAARIHCTIGAGTGPDVLFLNGAFSTRRDWKHVLRALPPHVRTVTFDARGRGRSADSPDYSFSGALEDVGAVIEATGLANPVLVGWSHGATLAIRHAATHPGEVAGVVLVDGAFPVRVFHEKARRRVRRQYRLLRLPMRVLGSMRLLARMTHHQAAHVVIELDEIDAGLLPDYRNLTCPALLVVGSGPHHGSPADEMRTMRDAAQAATAANALVRVHAVVASNHLRILRANAAEVASAVLELAGGTPPVRREPPSGVG